MANDYWTGRWERGETGWHQAQVEPELIAWASRRKPGRVFVPLCGKSLDLKWLLDQGNTVVGVELSSLACEAFFTENGLRFERSSEGPFAVFRSGNITLYCGNFFDLTPELLGRIDAVYDRAALIALPPEVRVRYSAHLLRLLRASLESERFEMLQLLLVRTPHDENGPPFSVSQEELRKLYDPGLKFTLLKREKIEGRSPPGVLTEQLALKASSPSVSPS